MDSWFQYAEDILLYYRFKEIDKAITLLEKATRKLKIHLQEFGLEIAPKKCQLCILDRRRLDHSEVSLQVENITVKASLFLLYLGIMLDTKLSWKNHIDHIGAKALAAINVLKTLGKVSWGANSEVLLQVYKGLIRAHLKWGAPLFAGETISHLKKLGRIQYQALRFALGCMRTTPIPILLAEANEPPQEVRRSLILNKYSLRISGWRDNPVAPRIRGLKERTEKIPSAQRFIKKFAPLGFIEPVFSMLNCTSKPNRPIYFDHPWVEIVADFSPLIDLDAGYNLKNTQHAELEFNTLEVKLDKVVICSDSMIALLRIIERMRDFAMDLIFLSVRGKSIKLLWIPAHSDMSGNTQADKLAKIALSINIGTKIYPLQEMVKLLQKDHSAGMKRRWPYFDNARTKQKYFEYVDVNTPRPWFAGYAAPRKYINLITRMRTGHICTGTHFGRMGWNLPTQCKCGFETSSIKHYLQDCVIFNNDRENFQSFLREKLGNSHIFLENLDFLIFFPNLEIIQEIGKFCLGKDIII